MYINSWCSNHKYVCMASDLMHAYATQRMRRPFGAVDEQVVPIEFDAASIGCVLAEDQLRLDNLGSSILYNHNVDCITCRVGSADCDAKGDADF